MNFQAEKEKSRAQSDRGFFIKQVHWQLTECNWDAIDDFDEIKSNVTLFQLRLDQFYKICSDLEVWFGQEVDTLGFRDENDEIVLSLREKIRAGKARLTFLRLEKDQLEKDRLAVEREEKLQAEADLIRVAKLKEDTKIREILDCAESHRFEIKSRSERFSKKCLQDFNNLTDHEILDIKKGEENLHVELRELFDKVSSFEKLVMPCGERAGDMRDEVLQRRDACSEEFDEFLIKLSKVIKNRDISERKLKNASGLDIGLKKFKGYDSEMDIYTFRSSFRKLVEPEVQGSIMAETLKNKYLDGAAKTLVSKIDQIDEIWQKLTEVYGDSRLLLQNKLSSLGKIPGFERFKKDDEKTANNIMHILNLMSDLSKLAAEFHLEDELYHGPGLNKVLDVIGRDHERKFIKSIALDNIGNRAKWERLVAYLKGELKIREAWILNEKVRKANLETSDKSKTNDTKKESKDQVVHLGKPGPIMPVAATKRITCFLCGKTDDHVQSTDSKGNPVVEYVACSMFVEKNPRDRDKLLFRKRFCCKCLKPGVRFNANHDCDTQFTCGQNFVNKNGVEAKCSKHVLVCGFHCDEKNNLDLLELYKKKSIFPNQKFLEFTRKISISCFSESYTSDGQGNSEEHAIFSFQLINVAGLDLCQFYDNGCGNAVFSRWAIEQLVSLGRAEQTCSKSLILRGVNGQESICPYGEWKVRLPLLNGNEAILIGICVDEVTETFPEYPLDKVEDDFRMEFGEQPENQVVCPRLPKLSKKVGGKVDIMIGSQYLKYFPREVGRLESGLTLYKSLFRSSDGTNGIISGPHPSFTLVNRASHFALGSCRSYYSDATRAYLDYLAETKAVSLLGYKEPLTNTDHLLSGFDENVDVQMFADLVPGEGVLESEERFISYMCLRCKKCNCQNVYASKRAPRDFKIFEELENTGTDISYRCIDCRNCKECKYSSRVEEISIVEEVEQDLINKSVTVDLDNRCSLATLPFTADPDTRLATNKTSSLKMYKSQIRRLNKSEKDLQDALDAERKLQDLGYVDWLQNLDKETQDMIFDAPVMHFIAWHIVRSGTSVTTPVRPVFNASAKTPSGYSLNDLLPKGTNNLNSLIEIMIRWTIKRYGYHTDVRKMYNSVVLRKDFWRYQLYWWSPNLGLNEEPAIKIIKTCIYGVKSSGNQAERALRLVAEKMSSKYPLAHEIVRRDIYVDDCVSGEDSEEQRAVATDQLSVSILHGGFALKGVTLSGEDPSDTLSNNGKSIMVGGQNWFPKEDYLVLNIGKISDKFKQLISLL